MGEALAGSGSGGGGSGDGSGGVGGSGSGAGAAAGAAGGDRIRPGQSVTVGEGEVPGVTAGEWVSYRVSGLDTAELRSAAEGTSALVGGQDAELVDAEDYAAEDRQVIFPLVLALVFVALVVLLRAFLAPLIMVSTVLLTNVAALGIGWWISSGVFGFNAFADTTPLYAFVFLVALGVDYTIFLITRTREEVVPLRSSEVAAEGEMLGGEGAGGESPTKSAVLVALSSTGGVITSAGVLLAAVFAALGVLPLVALAQVGVVIFVGVLLDTLIVRTLLIPSVVQLLGERFWWPANPAQSTPGADEGA
ncbi:MAG TPA: MMPL family transporter [Candidatus Corynebacterium gallistercoris]|uniref:MMPL family transporter n=1 Tax=Candidatus Corynebacterium gallistercoris TaxID=2838530 RepID=A0A9D1RZ43_9CORY|nr:MMPL family transporter [Candidatus Corynebacterium gallistercoris]